MKLVQYPVRTVIVDAICEVCEKGKLRPTGKMLMVDPPKFVHKCNNSECETNLDDSHRVTYELTEKLPTLRYVPEGEMVDLNSFKFSTS